MDARLYDKLRRFYWAEDKDGYARRRATKAEKAAGAPYLVAMHREIMGIGLVKGRPGKPEVDHRNRRRLHNWRRNLRIVSRSINCINTSRRPGKSGFVGVCWFRPACRWRAYICVRGKQVHLGYFHTVGNALAARLEAERKFHR